MGSTPAQGQVGSKAFLRSPLCGDNDGIYSCRLCHIHDLDNDTVLHLFVGLQDQLDHLLFLHQMLESFSQGLHVHLLSFKIGLACGVNQDRRLFVPVVEDDFGDLGKPDTDARRDVEMGGHHEEDQKQEHNIDKRCDAQHRLFLMAFLKLHLTVVIPLSLLTASYEAVKFDAFVKSRISVFSVIPAEAGIQEYQGLLDPGFRRGDGLGDFLRVRQDCLESDKLIC
jgi:hypothetical protein